MAAGEIDLSVYIKAIKSEIDLVVTTIRDKGAKRFGRALGVAAAAVFAAYWFIYTPPQSKIARLGKEIEAARAMSQSAVRYRELRDLLVGSYGSLPFLKDQQQWLSNAMIDSLRADGLTPDSLRPVVENEVNGLVFQTSSVVMSLKFNDTYAWLLRLESARPLMHVGLLEVTKKDDMIGINIISCSVMTAIPKTRYN